jgi:hemerythrin-like domain-containing protein
VKGKTMKNETDGDRREFMRWAAIVGPSIVLSGCATTDSKRPEQTSSSVGSEEEEVSPAEDLMREHGVLDRVLLIYEEGIRRLNSKQDLDPVVLTSSAGIVRRFIEDYHEKLEENHLFPRFEKSGKLVELVAVLRQQHQAGRRLTDEIQHLATLAALKNSSERPKLQESLTQFIRMYRPHAAREDTVLFPALHSIVSSNEYDSMGDQFEDEEHKLFGADGFEKIVDEVAGLEKKFGIENLAQFTPAQ